MLNHAMRIYIYLMAIFGSYSYDPIKQVFEPKKESHDRPQIVNSSYVLSTAVGITDDHHHHHNTSDAIYRHHVTIVTPRPTQWWARKLPKNITNIRGGGTH
ncbi:uncharacterized protein LOC135086876 isoform X2 [Ostrinia nubilalis]|uniref:uncharacterized protein LOC135086876 isoform X2 n=1 Tax=Ostrinia nubilalis TaxID=29057 RepID=UPI0030825BBC